MDDALNYLPIEIDYIKLMSIQDYLNSKNDNGSYLDDNNTMWLSNSSKKDIWVLNKENLSLVDSKHLYQVKPMITLNSLTEFTSGNGSVDNPYKIKNDEIFLQVQKNICTKNFGKKTYKIRLLLKKWCKSHILLKLNRCKI